MSTVKTNNVQIGQSLTATNNFTWYQPASPDGTVRLGNGNSGSVSDVITVGTTGNLTFANSVSLSAASTKTLTLNGGAGSNGLVLDASNNIALGASSANGVKLYVNGGIAVQGGGYPSTGVGFEAYYAASSTYIGSYNRTSNAYAPIYQYGSQFSFDTGGTVRMTLDSSGNLGLGVTPSGWSALKAIELGGGVSLATNSSPNNGFIGANTYFNGSNWIYKANGYANIYSVNDSGSGSFVWYRSTSGTAGATWTPTQAMTLDASGNLSLGNTGGFARLCVSATPSASYGVVLAYSSAAGDVSSPIYVCQKTDNNSTTSQRYVAFLMNGGAGSSGYITANGANSATFTSSSDARLKENITALPNQLANICALKPSEFDYKDGSGHQIGFIAQEMQEVYPDCVAEDENEMLMVSGWSKTEARLVKAIQELSAELNELKKRIN